jgi:hypothetical protein
MKIDLDDKNLRTLLEIVGTAHAVACLKGDKKEKKELTELTVILIDSCEEQHKTDILEQVFDRLEPK